MKAEMTVKVGDVFYATTVAMNGWMYASENGGWLHKVLLKRDGWVYHTKPIEDMQLRIIVKSLKQTTNADSITEVKDRAGEDLA